MKLVVNEEDDENDYKKMKTMVKKMKTRMN